MEKTDEFYLDCALNLAKLGEAKAFPNPMVGALIVSNGLIVAEGFHQEYGKAHAEPNAVSNLRRNILLFLGKELGERNIELKNLDYLMDLVNKELEKGTEKYFDINPKFSYLSPRKALNEFFKKSLAKNLNDSLANDKAKLNIDLAFEETFVEKLIHKLLLSICSEASIYVSLEPCNHYGKTAPCTKLIKELGFKRLVYAYEDPNPIIRNNSENLLCNSDIEILYLEKNSLKERIELDNRIFLSFMKTKADPSQKSSKRFWLSLKVASYPDGSMETKKHEKWISNSASRKDVQRLRACHEILITGINTIKNDNPLLNVRLSPEEMNLSDITERKILILSSTQEFTEDERKSLRIFQTNAEQEIIEAKSLQQGLKIINDLSAITPKRIMLEAGPRLVSSFLNNDVADLLVDEIIHYEPFIEDEVPSTELIYQKKERILKHYLNINPRLNLRVIKEEILYSEGERTDLKLIILALTQWKNPYRGGI